MRNYVIIFAALCLVLAGCTDKMQDELEQELQEEPLYDENLIKESLDDLGVLADHELTNDTDRRPTGNARELITTKNSCSDTDDGIDYEERGTVTSKTSDGTESRTDRCIVGNFLTEYYCQRDQSIGSIFYSCSYGCSKGACKSETETTCTDSDGGRVYDEQGTVTSTSASGTEEETDSCTANRIREYYCNDDGSIGEELYDQCPFGCIDGRCKLEEEFTCRDSDGGFETEEQGTIVGIINDAMATRTDECVDENTLWEFYCGSDGNRHALVLGHECEYGCVDGACRTEAETSCTDSDGGIDYETQGTTTGVSADGTERTETDYCDGDNVYEHFCFGDIIRGVSRACTYGCSDGACNAEPVPDVTCEDTDGGTVYDTRGTTTSGTEEETDYCIGNFVREYRCGSDDTVTSTLYTCAHGCSDGACNPEPEPDVTCVDSDGGTNYIEQGTVTSGTEEETDYCTGNEITEYYCGTDDSIREDVQFCNYRCEEGACKTAAEVFESPTGKRKILIINDLDDLAGFSNRIISVRLGQTLASLDTDATEVLETDTYVCSLVNANYITPDSTLRTVDPSTLTDPETVIGSPDDRSYRYFTVPETFSTPYYLRVYFGTWDPDGYCWQRRTSQVQYCDGSTIFKNWQDFVDPHEDSLVLAIKMSGFAPAGHYLGSEFCD